MEFHYTGEKNTAMLLSLMKAHGIRKIIASPGATNISLVASAQQDEYFQIYSSVDERSAAYIACGMAAESGEPVALSCTGATASRNYVSGLTEAYYRKLPVLAITSTQHTGRIGQMVAQVVDRSTIMNDIAVCQVDIPTIHSEEDEWSCNVKLNTALLALRWHGGGPVHINLTTTYNNDFSVQSLPNTRVIKRVGYTQMLPKISHNECIAIFVGAHDIWSKELTEAVDMFCECYDAVVLNDSTSNYHGKYGVVPNLITNQSGEIDFRKIDTLIHIGNISGAYVSLSPQKVWRVNPDGEIRDFFKKLEYVFEMDEITFFKKYVEMAIEKKGTDYYQLWKSKYDCLFEQIPELPFSNIWTAKQLYKKLPVNCNLYLGILNTLRSWNFFELPNGVDSYSNTGGFGIDGIASSALGVSLCNPKKLCFCVIGDLAMFYDLNVLGNRHIQNNLRIMLINNGVGTEFKNYNHRAEVVLGSESDEYVAARGHYGQKSEELVKNFAQNLGFEYLAARNKDEFLAVVDYFTHSELTERPMIFEVFTESEDESQALKIMNTLSVVPESAMKSTAKKILGETGIKIARKLIRR